MPHPRSELLRARLSVVRRDLDEVMGRLSPDLLPWAPSPGMRTVGGQLIEILGTELQLMTLLREDRWISDEEVLERYAGGKSLDLLRSALIDVRNETLQYLGSLSEEELAEEVEFGGGWFGSLGLDRVPRAEVFVSVADHEWYHVGQLTSYLWSRGDHPYHW